MAVDTAVNAAAEAAAGGSFLSSPGAIAIGAALAMGLSALAAAWSQASVGSSAMGLVSERPELSGNVLIWMALPEVFALLGFIIAFLLLGKV
ncbi:MAG: ATPase [Methanobacteriota archaeon]|nr:MAG: ATPase [Euryarchaeota archaeon]